MKVYVAGASKEIARCKAAMAAVRELGHEVTYDWTADIEAAAGPDETLDRAHLAQVAIEDLRGVKRARLFWLLLPEGDSTGAWTELGYALGLGVDYHADRPAIIVSGQRRRSCFWTLADHVFDTDGEAREWIRWAV